MKDSYLTIKSPSEGLYKEKGSKFLAYAYPVTDEEKIKEILQSLKKEYYDARHHCYAFMLGKDKNRYRANDDGEPGNSAGVPILNQIRSKEVTDVLVVVVRYFGGTKLGVSGLINAYKTAAAEALDQAEIVEAFVTQHLTIRFEYMDMNDVMRVAKEYDLDLSQQTFDEKCNINFEIREGILDEVKGKLEKVPSLEFAEE
ncbi:YigZ family protein [Rapidithrix thailandica]|uniref:YigZ family protein n=1 Tax=Rapidithrix thailandica TaxID=413964 RepID=A0AAW9RVR6_9BACT